MNNNSNGKFSTSVKDSYDLTWGCATWIGHGEKEGEVTHDAWAIAPREELRHGHYIHFDIRDLPDYVHVQTYALEKDTGHGVSFQGFASIEEAIAFVRKCTGGMPRPKEDWKAGTTWHTEYDQNGWDQAETDDTLVVTWYQL